MKIKLNLLFNLIIILSVSLFIFISKEYCTYCFVLFFIYTIFFTYKKLYLSIFFLSYFLSTFPIFLTSIIKIGNLNYSTELIFINNNYENIIKYSMLFILPYYLLISLLKNNINKRFFQIFSKVATNNFIIYIGVIIAIGGTFIFAPTIPFSGTRPSSLLPGNAWNYFINLGLFFLIIGIFKKKRFLKISVILFVIFWLLGNYHRADNISFILLLFFYYSYQNKKFNSNNSLIFFIILIIINIFIEILREGGFENFLYLTLLNATAINVTYIFGKTIELYNSGILAYGYTYNNYFIGLLPSFIYNKPEDFDYSMYLLKYFYNHGGGYFLTEPLLNFGIYLFPILAILIFSILYCLHLPSRSELINFSKLFLLVYIYISTFRFFWYSAIYTIKPIFLYFPLAIFIYVFSKHFSRIYKIN